MHLGLTAELQLLMLGSTTGCAASAHDRDLAFMMRALPVVTMTLKIKKASQSPSGVESCKAHAAYGGQQGLLQRYETQKKDFGKCVPPAEWSRGLGTKDMKKAQVLKVFFTTLCLLLRFVHRNPKSLRPVGKSGAMMAGHLYRRSR